MGIIDLVSQAISAFRIGRAARADIPDDRCVACDSEDLEELGEAAYRCRACGYEGGSGLRLMQEDQRFAKVDAMSPEQRRASAKEDLRHAHALLLSARGNLDGATSAAHHDILGMGSRDFDGSEGGEKHSMLTNASGDMSQARRVVQMAVYKLTGHRQPTPEDRLPDGVGTWLLDQHVDNPFHDFLTWERIQDGRELCEELREGVEDLYDAHFPGEPLSL